MIEVVNGRTYTTLGFEYTGPEQQAATMSVDVYAWLLRRGTFPADAAGNEYNLKQLAVIRTLLHASRVIPVEANATVTDRYLPFMIQLDEGLATRPGRTPLISREAACERIGVDPEAFSDNAMIAQDMLDPRTLRHRYVN